METVPQQAFRLGDPDATGHLVITDESLETGLSGRCDLFLSIEPDGIRVALKEKKNYRFLALETFRFEAGGDAGTWPGLLEKFSKESKLLREYEFSHVWAAVFSPSYTLVPDALFRKGDERLYLDLNFSDTSGMQRFSREIPAFSLCTVYGIGEELVQKLNHLFEQPVILHHSSVLLEALSRKLKSGKEPGIFLNIRNRGMDVVVTEGKKLVLMNTFSCHAAEDFLYYTLFICEQADLNPETIGVSVAGEVNENSAIYKMLFKYIRNLRFQPSAVNFEKSYRFNEIPGHYFYSLFHLALCVS